MRGPLAKFLRAATRIARPEWIRSAAIWAGLDPLVPPRLIGLPEGQRLMVLAPHPDDESIGCGGLIARWRQAGRPASVLLLTDGARGARDLRGGEAGSAAARALAETRRKEAEHALAALGGTTLHPLDLPDGELARNREALAKAIAGHLARERPDVLALPFVTDRHPDHVAAFAGAVEALARIEGPKPGTILCYEVWAPLPANAVIDISDVIEAKRAAIACHASQMAEHDYVEGALSLNRYRALAALTRVRYAEAYWMGDAAALAGLWRQARS